MQHKKNSKRGKPRKMDKTIVIKRKGIPTFMNKRIVFTGFAIALISVAVMFLVACTYSINMVHSDGEATDVIDETDEAQANPDIQIPLPDLT